MLSSSTRRSFVYYGVLGISAVSFVLILLWRSLPDLSVPVGFSSDGLFYHALASVVYREGWWFHSFDLGFPMGAPFVTFPSNSNVDYAVVWIVSQFAPDSPTALNLAWVTLLGAGAVGCAACLRMLGISRLVSFVAGMLYATMPFAIYRNVGQFSLTPYLVVYPATISILSFTDGWTRLNRPQRTVLSTGCALLGLNYIYYAFFACLALSISFVFQLSQHGRRSWVGPYFGALVIVILATLANLTPSFAEWFNHGFSPNIRAKTPQEFDYYALKLRHLLSPLWEHSFSPFKSWLAADYRADYPLETENTTARLGLVASLGFVFLLIAPLLGSRAWPDKARAIGTAATVLTVGLLLYSVTGGLGSLFNLLIAPEIRAANRVTPYLYFFSLIAVSIQLDRIKPVAPTRRFVRFGFLGLIGLVLGLGLFDQSHAFIGLNRIRNADSKSANETRSFVSNLEKTNGIKMAVFQLPFTEFLNDNGMYRMGPYDHFRPVVYSNKIRWSYPSMSQKSQLWTAFARTLTPKQLVDFLRASGFTHIWIDRYGYADGELENSLLALLGPLESESPSQRYGVFSLPPYNGHDIDPEIARAAARYIDSDIRVTYSSGFYNAETTEHSLLRWSKRDSTIEISNHGPSVVTVNFCAYFQSLVPGPVVVRIESPGRSDKLAITNKRSLKTLPLSIAANSTITITFHQQDDSFALPNDRRELYFGLIDPYITFQED